MTGASISIKIDRREFATLIAAGKNLKPALEMGARRQAINLSNWIIENLRGDPVKGRSGQFAKSWRLGSTGRQVSGGASFTLEANNVRFDAALGSDAPQARILEEGGTVTPTSAEFLAIPLGPAKTGAGVVRRGAESPKMVEGLFPIVSKRGNLLLVKRKGKGKRAGIEPWYLLRRSVNIEAKRYLSNAALSSSMQAGFIWAGVVQEHLGAK